MYKNLWLIFCLIFICVSCAAPEEEEDDDSRTQTTSPIGDDGSDDDSASSITVDGNATKFDFIVEVTSAAGDSENSSGVLDADNLPATSNPSINASSMLTTLTTIPANVNPGTGLYSTTGSYSDNIQTPIDLTSTRSHEVKLSSSEGASCSSDFVSSCALKDSDKSIAVLTDVVTSSFTESTTNYVFKVDTTSLEAPLYANIVKKGPVTDGAISERPWIIEAVELNGKYYAITWFINSGTDHFLQSFDTSLDNPAEVLLKKSASQSLRLENLIAYNGNIYFAAKLATDTDYHLYKFDPTGKTFTNLSSSTNVLINPENFTIFNSNLYFTADSNASAHQKLYKIDSSGNIHQKSNMNSSGTDGIRTIINTSNGLYLDIANPSNPSSLVLVRFNSDETLVPIVELGTYAIKGAVVVGSKTYIATAQSSSGAGLYRDNMDGTVSQPMKTGAYTAASKPYPVETVAELDGNLYFIGGSPKRLFRFMESDSTAYELPKTHSSLPDITEMITFNGALYYAAKDNSNFTKLYKQTAEGNVEKVLNNNSGADNPRNFLEYKNELYFIANDSSGTPTVHRMSQTGEISDLRHEIDGTTFLNSHALDSGIIYADKNYFDVITKK